jgi:hypothetical protein
MRPVAPFCRSLIWTFLLLRASSSPPLNLGYVRPLTALQTPGDQLNHASVSSTWCCFDTRYPQTVERGSGCLACKYSYILIYPTGKLKIDDQNNIKPNTRRSIANKNGTRNKIICTCKVDLIVEILDAPLWYSSILSSLLSSRLLPNLHLTAAMDDSDTHGGQQIVSRVRMLVNTTIEYRSGVSANSR